eukprot:SAG31_NODE_26754_length_437_cov_0.745562_1_plen_22_part_10
MIPLYLLGTGRAGLVPALCSVY